MMRVNYKTGRVQLAQAHYDELVEDRCAICLACGDVQWDDIPESIHEPLATCTNCDGDVRDVAFAHAEGMIDVFGEDQHDES